MLALHKEDWCFIKKLANAHTAYLRPLSTAECGMDVTNTSLPNGQSLIYCIIYFAGTSVWLKGSRHTDGALPCTKIVREGFNYFPTKASLNLGAAEKSFSLAVLRSKASIRDSSAAKQKNLPIDANESTP